MAAKIEYDFGQNIYPTISYYISFKIINMDAGYKGDPRKLIYTVKQEDIIEKTGTITLNSNITEYPGNDRFFPIEGLKPGIHILSIEIPDPKNEGKYFMNENRSFILPFINLSIYGTNVVVDIEYLPSEVYKSFGQGDVYACIVEDFNGDNFTRAKERKHSIIYNNPNESAYRDCLGIKLLKRVRTSKPIYIRCDFINKSNNFSKTFYSHGFYYGTQIEYDNQKWNWNQGNTYEGKRQISRTAEKEICIPSYQAITSNGKTESFSSLVWDTLVAGIYMTTTQITLEEWDGYDSCLLSSRPKKELTANIFNEVINRINFTLENLKKAKINIPLQKSGDPVYGSYFIEIATVLNDLIDSTILIYTNNNK